MEETRKQWPPIQASGLKPDITHSTCSVPDFFVTELPFSSSALSFGWTVRRVGTCMLEVLLQRRTQSEGL
jgi:hypothetical protein